YGVVLVDLRSNMITSHVMDLEQTLVLGAAWTTGLGVARMVATIAYGKGELWPSSVVLAGEYGIEGVSLSVPVSLGRRGAEEIHEWGITQEEHAALHEAATRIREVTNTINVTHTTLDDF